jgi:four helix bundle protein
MTVRSYRDLEVWQMAIALVTDVYALTKEYPREELYGLTNQMRRAAVSIPSNIAEGRAKRSTKDFIRYINIAYGSAAELETQLIISRKLDYITDVAKSSLLERLARISRMLNGMLSGLEKKMSSSPRMPNADPRMPEEYNA